MASDSVVLLLNLGSPDSPSTADVRRYLREFLMDERVIDVPWLQRFCLVNGMILPFRPAKTAEAYRAVWEPGGSPLIVKSLKVQSLLSAQVPMPVELGMRYGNPSIPDVVRRILATGATEILLVPLYPHYAMSSYETCVVRVREELQQQKASATLKVLPPFYDDPLYIDALIQVARPYLDTPYDHLLFSYHGLPVRHMKKADPTGAHCQTVKNCCETKSIAHETCYRAQAFKTTRAFVKQTGLSKNKYSVAFQSRLGRDPWLPPYTDHELTRLGKEGVKKMLVICPSFVTDCLETLEEIALRGRETFLEAGGEELTLIPCLNEHPAWIDTLATWCRTPDQKFK